MARKVLVSRVGLTRCPSCSAHIKVAAELKATACPFCGAALAVAVSPPPGPLSRAFSAGRSGLLAASLLGATSLGALGCDDSEEPGPSDDMSADTAEETGVTPLYGEPADVQSDAATDATVTPLYGEPADLESDTATDTTVTPLYGEPADVTGDDVDDAEDATAVPLYGVIPADVTDDGDAG